MKVEFLGSYQQPGTQAHSLFCQMPSRTSSLTAKAASPFRLPERSARLSISGTYTPGRQLITQFGLRAGTTASLRARESLYLVISSEPPSTKRGRRLFSPSRVAAGELTNYILRFERKENDYYSTSVMPRWCNCPRGKVWKVGQGPGSPRITTYIYRLLTRYLRPS
jgi:hypothetical protein